MNKSPVFITGRQASWKAVKQSAHKIENNEDTLTFDDMVQAKSYSKETDLIYWLTITPSTVQ